MYKNSSRYSGALVLSAAIVLAAQAALSIGQVPVAPAAPMASSFPGPLWDVENPVGGTASVSGEHLFLNVPGGSNHDALVPSNQAVRVVQPIGNQDFDVSIKIDSPVVATAANTSQGLMLLSDNKNFMMFALVTNGTNLGLTVSNVTAGVAATILNQASFNEYRNPMYLRLARTGVTDKAYYSVDGVTWSQAASFTDYKVPALIGPFAGNYNGNPAKAVAVVMAINWFNVQ